MPNLKVISRSSCEFSKKQELSLKDISKTLDVEYVLEGNVQKRGNKVKISVSLTNAVEDQLKWSPPPFERDLEDVFSIQSEIAQNIAEQLSLKLTEEDKEKLEAKPTESQEAYDYYTRGMELVYRGQGTEQELNRIVGFFEKAIDADPNFTMAFVGLAQAYLHYIFWGRGAPNDYLDKALEPALEALRLDPENGACYGALGSISFHRFNKESATDYLKKALEKTPNFQKAYEFLGWMSVHNGEWDAALEYFRKGS